MNKLSVPTTGGNFQDRIGKIFEQLEDLGFKGDYVEEQINQLLSEIETLRNATPAPAPASIPSYYNVKIAPTPAPAPKVGDSREDIYGNPYFFRSDNKWHAGQRSGLANDTRKFGVGCSVKLQGILMDRANSRAYPHYGTIEFVVATEPGRDGYFEATFSEGGVTSTFLAHKNNIVAWVAPAERRKAK